MEGISEEVAKGVLRRLEEANGDEAAERAAFEAGVEELLAFKAGPRRTEDDQVPALHPSAVEPADGCASGHDVSPSEDPYEPAYKQQWVDAQQALSSDEVPVRARAATSPPADVEGLVTASVDAIARGCSTGAFVHGRRQPSALAQPAHPACGGPRKHVPLCGARAVTAILAIPAYAVDAASGGVHLHGAASRWGVGSRLEGRRAGV